jgi:TPR repeat protein
MLQLRYSLALLWLTISCQAHADFPTAKALFEQQDYSQAKPRLEALAELGHLEAQYLLSRMYAEGLGVDADIKLGLVDLSRWIIRQHDGLVQLLSPKTNHDNPSCQGQC